MPTVGISIVRSYSEKVKPPRTVFLKWPFGHPLGEPFNRPQQRAVLKAALRSLYAIGSPGEILDLPFRWRREKYVEEGPLEEPFGGGSPPAPQASPRSEGSAKQ